MIRRERIPVGRASRLARILQDPLLLLLVAASSPAYSGASEQFRSSGKTVHVDRHRPMGSAHAPLVILLHGAAGPASHRFPYQKLAAALANRGMAVEIPHYLDAAKPDRDGSGEPYGVWISALRDEIETYRERSGMAAVKTALVGFSLGASLALAAAADGLPVSAVAECAGSLPDRYFAGLRGLPPILILHNRGDTVMPVANAEQLLRLCDMRHYPCEAKIGSGAAHGLPSPEAESIDRIVQFISAHVL